ncbi:MAG: hypothetical protein A3G18_06665 [Rhodospirillales bacterium RIFCSPLOWO2_12_FULL_58_28]|nr:MAG: hypothetical protein A3H92_06300 [Rhodospirillales bacterium RIFCSPLOWO2_02_FULL_58_16]OHC79385.1 MAG: hypothetical protein A3G18_06665 [Rhodospirillales bacterium RIFCSPLOWO2_12_FULL_58_28]
MAFLVSTLSSAGIIHRFPCEGVLEVDVDKGRVTICLVEYCADERILTREWAAMNPTLYVTVGPKERDWLLQENWLKNIRLADIVSGRMELASAITDTATFGRPSSLGAASIPIYTKGARPIHYEAVEPVHADRAFTVAVGPSTVMVNGVTVIHKQASARLVLFKILWGRFLDNLKNGIEPDDFPPMTLEDIAELVQTGGNKEVEDVETIRRNLNRLQTDIEKAVKKYTGAPIGAGDIIQTIPRHVTGDDYGFRINPVSVMPRLFSAVAPDLSEEK